MNTELLTKLTQTAFNAGNPRAGLLLGKMAERGVVFNKDLSQALALYRWAAKRDFEEAKKSAAELEKSLTKDQIQAADIFLKQLEEQQKKEPAAGETKADDEKDKKKPE
jgi:TPR repeat protein